MSSSYPHISQILIAASRNCRDECPDCTKQLKAVVYHINKQISNINESEFDRQVSGDLYTVVILCIFATIILLLMVRAIKPSESVDDQVILLLRKLNLKRVSKSFQFLNFNNIPFR